jgi:hypothetical protein
VRFKVCYIEHRRMTAIADEGDVEAALQGYLDGAAEYHHGLSNLARARVALDKVRAGITPDDMDIIAEALSDEGFEVPDGTKPDEHDSNSDYMVTAGQ